MPLEIKFMSRTNPLWPQHLRWVNPAHYDYEVGCGNLRANYRAFGNGHFLFHLLPSVLQPQQRRELFQLLLVVARNKGVGTRRVRNAGGGVRGLTNAGSVSTFPRTRPLAALRFAREGTFGFEGLRSGVGCCPSAFNREHPQEYRELEPLCDNLNDLAQEHEPERWKKQWNILSAHRSLSIGRTVWTQGVANLSFPMAVHRDHANIKGSISALAVVGDYDGGPLIFPAHGVAVFLQPGDVLFFDGNQYHGVGPFMGVRLSLVLYANRAVLGCPIDCVGTPGRECAQS